MYYSSLVSLLFVSSYAVNLISGPFNVFWRGWGWGDFEKIYIVQANLNQTKFMHTTNTEKKFARVQEKACYTEKKEYHSYTGAVKKISLCLKALKKLPRYRISHPHPPQTSNGSPLRLKRTSF